VAAVAGSLSFIPSGWGCFCNCSQQPVGGLFWPVSHLKLPCAAMLGPAGRRTSQLRCSSCCGRRYPRSSTPSSLLVSRTIGRSLSQNQKLFCKHLPRVSQQQTQPWTLLVHAPCQASVGARCLSVTTHRLCMCMPFCRAATRHHVEFLHGLLQHQGLEAAYVHGNMDQVSACAFVSLLMTVQDACLCCGYAE
jgi:hypothetical protein